jgi:branched-chain amino acid transport system substrate-binding protein
MAVVALAGCRSANEPPPVLVGLVVTTTGPDKHAGDQAERGMLLAVKLQHEEAREKSAQPLKVIITNAEGRLGAFAGEAVRLVSVSKAVALFGGNTVEEVLSLDSTTVPVITPLGRRTQKMSERVFCTGLSPEHRGKVLARYSADVLKVARCTVLMDEQNEDAVILADAFVRDFPEQALKSTKKTVRPTTLRFNKDSKLAALAETIEKAKPQGVLFAGTARDLLTFKAAFKKTTPILLFGGAEGSGKALLDGAEGEGVYLVTAFTSDLDVGRTKTFVSQYQAAYSEKPDVHAALAYDAARLFDEAFKRCEGTATPERLREKLLEIKDFAGLTGPLAFAKDGRLRRPAFVVQTEERQLKVKKPYDAEE